MQVVDVHLLLDGVVAVIVGGAVLDARLDPAAGHPHGEAFGVVVAAVLPLGGRGPAELAAPEDERVVEQAAGFQVAEQAGDGPVDFQGVLLVALLEVAVLVPLHEGVAVGHLHEPHAPLGEPAGHQALAAEVGGDRVVQAVELAGRPRLARDVLDLGHGGLHPEGELERVQAPFEGLILARLLHVLAVDLVEQVELEALDVPRQVPVGDVAHAGLVGGGAGVPQGGPLVRGGEEGRAPVVHAAVGEGRADGDEAGEVPVLGPEPVGDPRAHARPDEVVAAGVQLQQRPAVRRVGAVQGVEDAEVVDQLGDVREERADHDPALAVLLELPGRAEQLARLGELDPRLGEGERLAVVALEEGLVVERVHVRRPPLHEEEDDPLRPRREVRGLRVQGVRRALGGRRLLGQQPGEGHRAEPGRGATERLAARHGAGESEARVHAIHRM